MSSLQQQQQKQIARYSKNKTPEFEVTEQGQKPDSGTRTLYLKQTGFKTE